MNFEKAVKHNIHLKLAITGPSGSGKTYSALAIAEGIGEKIALIDTENGSASLYSQKFNFDTAVINPPFTIDKYLEGIKMAIDGNYDVLLFDSISHVWAGEGGLLEEKDLLDKSGRGNSYTNWATITKKYERFKSAIIQAPIHIISTIRSKQDYIIQENDKGKQVPIKVGLAPIQREGIEYDYTVVFDMAMNHTATASKDRTELFDSQIFTPDKQIGEILKNWINDSVTVAKEHENEIIPLSMNEKKKIAEEESKQAANEKINNLSDEAKAFFKKQKYTKAMIFSWCEERVWDEELIAKDIKLAETILQKLEVER